MKFKLYVLVLKNSQPLIAWLKAKAIATLARWSAYKILA